MKKIVFMALAVLAMMTTACDNKKSKTEAAEGEQTEQQGQTWQTYTNDNYGYSVEVPGDMSKRETLTEDNGTIYSYDGEEGVTFNRIDITGGEQIFGEEYTPEKVKDDYAFWTENKEIINEELGDDYFTYTIPGDKLTQTDYHVFKGSKYVVVSICYEPGFKDKLSGDVAKHVFQSIKFK